MINKIIKSFFIFLFSANINAADRDFCLLTDMSPDVDDLGALQVALYYHHTDKINLRCVIVGTSNSQAHRAIAHMIEWWGYNTEDIRIGENKSNNGLGFLNDRLWVNPYIDRYKPAQFEPEDGAVLLNAMLDKYPDMVVVEVGPANTVFNAAAKHRIKTYYQMGGNLPSGREFNLFKFPPGAQEIAKVGGVFWLDNLVGRSFKSGNASIFIHDTPVKAGYVNYTGGASRPSWDPFTFIWAVTGDKYFNKQQGNMTVSANGSNRWFSGDGLDYVAVTKNAFEVGGLLNSILALRPQDVESKRLVIAEVIEPEPTPKNIAVILSILES